jgi:hypothetical protein
LATPDTIVGNIRVTGTIEVTFHDPDNPTPTTTPASSGQSETCRL